MIIFKVDLLKQHSLDIKIDREKANKYLNEKVEVHVNVSDFQIVMNAVIDLKNNENMWFERVF